MTKPITQGLLRDRVLDLTRAQERLRQAHALAASAAGLLAELGVGHGIDLQTEIKSAIDARRNCEAAINCLEHQIARNA